MIMYTAKFGDLIEFSYPIGYSHWALYDGDGYVVHFAVAVGRVIDRQTIRRVHIREVKVPQGVRMFINNYHHSYVASDPWYIRQRVNALLGRQFTYDLFNLNCEHFATYLRYGRAVCNQRMMQSTSDTIEAVNFGRTYGMRKKQSINSKS
uniref:Si:ch211-229n2.7 n=1 Tax=Gouania willdenowi TaxID=441366 RepID=A0A8C5H9Y6_GOUWI